MLKRFADLARLTLQRIGFDLVRYRSLNAVLSTQRITTVLDVGANVGQYATRLRQMGYRGRIVSFEPQRAAFAALSAAAVRGPAWTVVNVGLGSQAETREINVYADPCLSSMLTLQQDRYIYGGSRLLRSEPIEIQTLDDIFDQYVTDATDQVYLKIDTQGFEKEVLRGAVATLPRITGMQLELSLTPIYAQQPALDEMIVTMRNHGFALWAIQRGIANLATGGKKDVTWRDSRYLWSKLPEFEKFRLAPAACGEVCR